VEVAAVGAGVDGEVLAGGLATGDHPLDVILRMSTVQVLLLVTALVFDGSGRVGSHRLTRYWVLPPLGHLTVNPDAVMA